MKVIDEELLRVFRNKLRCEHCGTATMFKLHPHHLWCRGMGGGSRLDVPLNLIALCASCHGMVHDGHILRCTLIAIVAAREKVFQGDVCEEIYRLLRTKKGVA